MHLFFAANKIETHIAKSYRSIYTCVFMSKIKIGVTCSKLNSGKICVNTQKQDIEDIIFGCANYEIRVRIGTTMSITGLVREIKNLGYGGVSNNTGIYEIDISHYEAVMKIISEFLQKQGGEFTYEEVKPSEAPKNISYKLC